MCNWRPAVLNSYFFLSYYSSWFRLVNSLTGAALFLFLSRQLSSLNTTPFEFKAVLRILFYFFMQSNLLLPVRGIWTATSGSLVVIVTSLNKRNLWEGGALQTECNCGRAVETASWVTLRVLESESYLLSFGGIQRLLLGLTWNSDLLPRKHN